MTILQDAAKAIEDRHGRHGDYRRTHQRIADLWGAYLGISISPTDVARMQILLKVARSQEGDETDEDHAKDIAGYAALLQKLANWLAGRTNRIYRKFLVRDNPYKSKT